MKKIKVLHYGLSDNKGGIENVIHSWFENKPEDVTFDFVNDSNSPIAYEDEFKKRGSKIYHIENRYKHPFKRFNSFKKIIDNGDYDYFHFHVMNNDEMGPIIACNISNKTKAIVHCHSMNLLKNSFKENILLFESSILGIGQKYLRLSCSEVAGKRMFGDKEFTVINNGIDFKRFSFNEDFRKEIRSKYNIKDEDIIIGHVGHDCVEKNYPFLMSVVKGIVEKNGNVKLLLVGNLNKSDNVKTLIKNNNLENNVIFTGLVSDIYKYYSAMDMFLFPSISEGLGIALIEAQASGLPCVVSDVIPQETKISDFIYFLKLEEDIFVDKIINIIDEHNDRKNIVLDNNYDIRNTTESMINFYRENL